MYIYVCVYVCSPKQLNEYNCNWAATNHVAHEIA